MGVFAELKRSSGLIVWMSGEDAVAAVEVVAVAVEGEGIRTGHVQIRSVIM